jgi:hypothetical protein
VTLARAGRKERSVQETSTPTIQFVDDTFVVPFRVEVWPGVPFIGTVRPATGPEVQAYIRSVRDAKDPTAQRCEFYARHLKSWNLPGPPTAANVARVPAAVFAQLDGIVCDGVGCEMILKKSDD